MTDFPLWFTVMKPITMKAEGFSPEPYLCPANRWTIGYGTTRYPNGVAVAQGDPRITEAQAEEYLLHSAMRVNAEFMKLIHVQLTVNQQAALTDLAYNIGVGAHDGVKGDLADSTLLDHLNRGDFAAAASQILVWDKAHVKGKVVALPGLTARRKVDHDLFLKP